MREYQARSRSISSAASMPRRLIRAWISGHSSLRKRLRSESPQSRSGARSDEHADAALHDDQALVLESLICLRHGQRVRLLLRGERTDRGEGIAVAEFSGENRIGDGLAQTDVDRLVVLFAERHAVIIQRIA